jgi:hypothetical protein
LLTTSPHGRPEFQQDLLAILNDPKVISLARRRAGDLDLAEDALQATYYAVARVADPGAITDLRAYFCRALIHEVYHQRAQLGAMLVDDFADLVDARQGQSSGGPPAPRPVAEAASTHVLAEGWFRLFITQRGELLARVPGRSSDPARYRDAILAVAEWALAACMVEKITNADYNAPLAACYPEWFDEPRCAESTRYKRFERARTDVRVLLQSIISRNDLNP